MSKKAYKEAQYPLNGAKINSVSIGKIHNEDLFLAGDSRNQVKLYQLFSPEETDNQEMSCFSSSTQANLQTQVSAVAFGYSEDQIFSGSSRGIINIWSIGEQKPSCVLKGHPTSINCFGVFPDEPNRLASGSYDTHIKLWDLREKNCVQTLKHHTKQVNSIDISPDGNFLLSGGEDNHIKLWDIRYPEKLVVTYSEHNSPVLQVKFNPEHCMFASCSSDKTAKYFQCEPNHYTYISSTDMVSTAITAIDFNMQGTLLYTASNDMLKAWNMGKNGMFVEAIEAPWKGVLNIKFVDDSALVAVSSAAGTLSVWVCHINQKIKKNKSVEPIKDFQLPKIKPSKEKIEFNVQEALKDVNKAIGMVNNLDFDKEKREKEKKKLEEEKELEKAKKKELEIQDQLKREEDERQRQVQRIQREEEEKARKEEEIVRIQKERDLLNQRVQNTFEQNNRENGHEITLQNDTMENSSLINLSTFMGDSSQRERTKQIELIGEILKDSTKHEALVSNRIKEVQPFIMFWKQGRIKNALELLGRAGVSVVLDCINAVIANPKFKSGMTPEVGVQFTQSLRKLMQQKHAFYVSLSMQQANEIVVLFKDQLIKVKTFSSMARVDLSREERIARYDKLIEAFLNMYHCKRLHTSDKYAEKYPEISEAAAILKKTLEEVLRKIMPNNQPMPA